jgi:hypothetical protein
MSSEMADFILKEFSATQVFSHPLPSVLTSSGQGELQVFFTYCANGVDCDTEIQTFSLAEAMQAKETAQVAKHELKMQQPVGQQLQQLGEGAVTQQPIQPHQQLSEQPQPMEHAPQPSLSPAEQMQHPIQISTPAQPIQPQQPMPHSQSEEVIAHPEEFPEMPSAQHQPIQQQPIPHQAELGLKGVEEVQTTLPQEQQQQQQQQQHFPLQHSTPLTPAQQLQQPIEHGTRPVHSRF